MNSITSSSSGGNQEGRRIFAKSDGETLADHTLRCLRVAEILLGNLPFDEDQIRQIRQDLRIALAIHDTGKAATGFQRSLEKDAGPWGHRHEILFAALASSLGMKEEVLLAIITHHRPLPSSAIVMDRSGLPEEEIPWLQDEDSEIWKALVEQWEENRQPLEKEWLEICHASGIEELSTRRLCLDYQKLDKSWLRRNRQVNKIPFERRYYAALLRGLLVSSDHIASNRYLDISEIPRIPVLQHYSLGKGVKIRNFQKVMGESAGNVILRAPTGSGKTLAALLWAARNQRKNGRLFYALPNIASINAMFMRIKAEFGEKNVGVLHSRVASYIYSLRERNDDILSRRSDQARARDKSSLARELWYPIRVCTPHQILRLTLQGRGWETMLSEFPNSCFIFDEIHAYDPIVTGLTLATARYLSSQNASCLFLSATMPQFLVKAIEKEMPAIQFIQPDPSQPSDADIMNQARHQIELIDGDIMSNLDFLIAEIKRSNSTLIVCNHVNSAQTVYRELRRFFKEKEVVLLHSRFNRRDRNEIEKSLQRAIPKVLVATQVVEVSLDIDFEQGFTEPAPIDALVQRLGRVNRYGRRPPASVRVFTKQLKDHDLYNKNIVDRSLDALASFDGALRECELVEVADTVYKNGYDEENESLFQQALNHRLIKDFEDNLIAGAHRDWVKDVIESSDGTMEVLPISLLDEYRDYEEKGLKIEADDLLVPIRLRSLLGAKEFVDFSDEPWKTHLSYSKERGLELKARVEDCFI
jgi:CRISPR-associated endonuclease/helicase Cas3